MESNTIGMGVKQDDHAVGQGAGEHAQNKYVKYRNRRVMDMDLI